MQAVPNFMNIPASERCPGSTQQAAQIQFPGIALRRRWQYGYQLQTLVQVGDRFIERQPLQRQASGGLPERNRGLNKARFGKMMREHLGFGAFDVREALIDHTRDLRVQLLSAALEQRLIRRVLHQRMLEAVDRIWRGAAAKGQPRLTQ